MNDNDKLWSRLVTRKRVREYALAISCGVWSFLLEFTKRTKSGPHIKRRGFAFESHVYPGLELETDLKGECESVENDTCTFIIDLQR